MLVHIGGADDHLETIAACIPSLRREKPVSRHIVQLFGPIGRDERLPALFHECPLPPGRLHPFCPKAFDRQHQGCRIRDIDAKFSQPGQSGVSKHAAMIGNAAGQRVDALRVDQVHVSRRVLCQTVGKNLGVQNFLYVWNTQVFRYGNRIDRMASIGSRERYHVGQQIARKAGIVRRGQTLVGDGIAEQHRAGCGAFARQRSVKGRAGQR